MKKTSEKYRLLSLFFKTVNTDGVISFNKINALHKAFLNGGKTIKSTLFNDALKKVVYLYKSVEKDKEDVILKIKNVVFINKIEDFLNQKTPKTKSLNSKQGISAEDFIGLKGIIPFVENPDEFNDPYSGLNKAVSPNEIYTMITNKIIELLEKKINFEKEWNPDKSGYLYAYNWVSKKPYRGINAVMLGSKYIFDPTEELLQNPYFLTFKQIEKYKGKLIKGSKGHRVIYYTNIYSYSQDIPKLSFRTFDKNKFISWTMTNINKIPHLKAVLKSGGFTVKDVAFQFADHNQIPILKYYNIYNGNDIEGIDFKLDKFKGSGKIVAIESKDKHQLIPVAESIIANYPKPSPTFKYGGNRAFYRPAADSVTMPKLKQFNFVQAYYTTFFHELIHSTGHKDRLKREFKGVFGTKKYAFEELIAELGASFLSAEAGILHHTIRNSAAYIKSWRSALLKEMKEDNKLFFRASSQAQKAVDFMLNKDKEGTPKYLKTKLSDKKAKIVIVKLPKKPLKKVKTAVKKSDKKPIPKTKITKPSNLKPATLKTHRAIATVLKRILNIGKKSTLPILSNILVKNGKLTITNLGTDIIYTPKNISLPTVDMVIDGTKFIESLKTNKVTEIDNNGYVHFGTTKLKIITTDKPTDFPKIKSFIIPKKAKKVASLDSNNLNYLLQKIASKDELKPTTMEGVYFDAKNNNIVATDAHILIQQPANIKVTDSFIFPKVLLPKGDIDVYAENKLSSDRRIFVQVDDILFSLKEIEGIYPNYLAVIPKNDMSVKFDTDMLISKLKTLLPFLDKKKGAIKITFDKNLLNIHALDENYSTQYSDSMPLIAQTNLQKDYKIGLNAHLLLKVLEYYNTKKISEINFNKSPKKAVLINEKALIMPTLLKGIEGMNGTLFEEKKGLKGFKPSQNLTGNKIKTARQLKMPKFKIEQNKRDPKKVCPKCKGYSVETATGNLTSFKYKCKKGHTFGKNEKYIGLSKPKTVAKRGNKPRNAGMNKGIVPVVVLPKKNNYNNLVRPLNYTEAINNATYKIGGNMARFLGDIEIKPKHSLAVTLDASQGAGKTRFLFEAINEFAKAGYKCLFVSLEEHPQSNLFKAKVKQYIKPTATPNISTIGDLPNGYKTLEDLIPQFDVIFIDSWGKVAEKERGIDFDNSLRKKFDGKLFFVIFQRTQDGKMRGGSKAQFDGDVILKIAKDANFRNNYVYADKNRYQKNDINQLQYNIFKNRLNSITNTEEIKRITINI